jgi:hypothetical protein
MRMKFNLITVLDIVGDKGTGKAPIIPVSKATWWAWVKKGLAPEPIRMNGRTFWKDTDVFAYAEDPKKFGASDSGKKRTKK